MSEWQDIATAPRNRTWVLLTGGRPDYNWDGEQPDAVVGQWNGPPENGNWQFAWYDGGHYGEYENPTHWMSLTALPRA